jgi:hypothetical protein
MVTMGCMVYHIHLDNNTYSSNKGTICSALLFILFDSDCVHIYINKLIYLHKQQGVVLNLLASVTSHTNGH